MIRFNTSVTVTTIFTYVGALLALVIGYSYIKLQRKRAYYKRHNIDGPEPLPIFGNLLEMIFSSRSKLEEEWRNKYGKCYVTFIGHTPSLVVSDPDTIRNVLISNFDKFPDSLTVPIATDEYQRHSLFITPPDRWKTMRSLMLPAFTSGKIKKMFALIQNTSQDMIEIFKTVLSDDSANVKDAKLMSVDQPLHIYSMNGIATCGFGMKIDCKGETNMTAICKRNKLAKQLAEAFYFPFYSMVLPYVFPLKLLKTIFGYYKRRKDCLDGISDNIQNAIKTREGKHHQFNDLLSYLHIARLGDELEFHKGQEKDSESHYEGNIDQKKVYQELCDSVKKGHANIENLVLSKIEFVANAVLLLVVGTNTTKEFLTTSLYALAHNSDVQERLYEELMQIRKIDTATGNASFDYETLIPHSYLDAFLSEVLRLLNPVLFISRRCREEHFLEKYKITLNVGDEVRVSIHGIHSDPDYWPDPDKFDPERFLPGNKEHISAGTYLPFGLGPRQCLGMRFSLAETKLALAQLITSFKFSPAPNSTFPPKEGFSSFLRVLNTELVYVEQRSQH